MAPLPQEIKELFFKTIKGDTSIEEFEQWLYADETLEPMLRPADYLDLISFNYKWSRAKYSLAKLLKKHVDLGEYETFRMLTVLKEAQKNDKNFVKNVDEIYDLECNGYWFLQDLVSQWWDAERLSPEMNVEIEKIIGLIESGQIILTWEEDEYGHFIFEDYTSDASIVQHDRHSFYSKNERQFLKEYQRNSWVDEPDSWFKKYWGVAGSIVYIFHEW